MLLGKRQDLAPVFYQGINVNNINIGASEYQEKNLCVSISNAY